MKITYGECHPTESREASFGSDYATAETVEQKEEAKRRLKEDIRSCKDTGIDKSTCEGNGCNWK